MKYKDDDLSDWIKQQKAKGIDDWNLKYAELLNKLYNGGGLSCLTKDENKLFQYCVDEGIITVEEQDDSESWKNG